MWAHARAEGWLYAFEGDAFTDSLLYPDPPDTGAGRQSTHGKQPITLASPNHVFPNPVTDMLQVIYTAQSTDNITIQIEDISGRILITQALQSGIQSAVDMGKLAPGMYLYR